jgi:hypothetical protein
MRADLWKGKEKRFWAFCVGMAREEEESESVCMSTGYKSFLFPTLMVAVVQCDTINKPQLCPVPRLPWRIDGV